MGVVLFGDSVDLDEFGDEIRGDTLLLLFNAAYGQTIPFTLPQLAEPQPWELLLDTAESQSVRAIFAPREPYPLREFSTAVFRLCTPQDRQTV